MAKKAPVPPGAPQMDWLQDHRTECFSALLKLPTGAYLKLVKDAHEQRGGITGQRDVLKTTTAKRIRDRMISDIRAGAVLPPVVIGVVVDKASAAILTDDKPVSQEAFLGMAAFPRTNFPSSMVCNARRP